MAALVLMAPPVFGKAYFASEEEMIQRSDAIAIVTIAQVDDTQGKGKTWTYHQRAHVIVGRTLKGTLPPEISLYGKEDFICAQIHFKPGQFLVFLRKDADLLTGSNWHLSVRPINGTQIEWYAPEGGLKLSWQSLNSVLDRLNGRLALATSKPK